jgi:nicotinamidase-related amidase
MVLYMEPTSYISCRQTERSIDHDIADSMKYINHSRIRCPRNPQNQSIDIPKSPNPYTHPPTMRPQILPLLATSTSLALAQNASSSPGYTNYPTSIASTITANSSLSFGQHYAILNLDLINGLVNPLASSPAGAAFINSTAAWIDAVHAQSPPPLSIFTRIYFSNARKPEVKPESGFAGVSASLGTANETATQIYPAFEVDEAAGDVVLQKTRYYAGTGNAMEEILRAQSIDTVILSGVRTSGVILSTAYRLFDLDYRVYVLILCFLSRVSCLWGKMFC